MKIMPKFVPVRMVAEKTAYVNPTKLSRPPEERQEMKKHTCRYRMDRKKSVTGLLHCWFWGRCAS